MAKIFNGSIPIEQIFKFNQNAPLDDRVSVQYNSDLAGIKAYPGLMVYVNSEDKYYYYNKDGEWAVSTSAGGGGIPSGTVLGTINNQEFIYGSSITIPGGGGTAQRVNIRYSNDGGQTITSEGDYIGFHVTESATPSTNPDDYKPWHRIEAGIGISNIDEVYKLGNGNVSDQELPLLGNGNKIISDYRGWSANPPEPTNEQQYLWGLLIFQYSNDIIELGTPRILAVKGSEFLLGDLDNEMDYIALSSEGKTLKVERRTTKLNVYFGSNPITLSNLTVEGGSGITGLTINKLKENGIYTGTVQFDFAEGTTLNDKLNFTITGECENFGSITISKTFTIATVREGSGAVIYQLVPEVSAIKVNSLTEYITESFKVGINKITGSTVEAVTNVSEEGIYPFYQIDNDNWSGFTTSTNIVTISATQYIKLKLLGENNINSSVIYDVETIPVVKDGTNGTSITIKGHGTLPSSTDGFQEGDAWITNDGHIWVVVNGQWVDCGQFKGDSGQSQYFHLKYSNNGTTFTPPSDPNDESTLGETEGIYMGFYVDNNPTDSLIFSDYTWHKISGADGAGSQWVYYLTDTENPYPTLVDESDKPEYQIEEDEHGNLIEFLPKDRNGVSWTDDPTGVDEHHRFEFCSQRKKRNGVWGPFGNVVLWSRYSVDGESSVIFNIALSRDYITSETVPENGIEVYISKIVGADDSVLFDTIQELTEEGLTLTYSKDGGSEVTATALSVPVNDIEYYITFYLKQGDVVYATKSCNVLKEGGVGISVGVIEEYYKRTTTLEAPSFPGRWNGNTPPANADNWSKSIQQVDSVNKYLWNTEVSIGTDGNVIGVTDPALIATYTEDGRGIVSIIEYYQTTNSVQIPDRWTGDDQSWTKVDTQKTILSDWKNNAQVTDAQHPYLWNFAKITYTKSKFFEYEVPQLVGNHASSPLILDLTNEMDSIAVDADGVLDAPKTLTTGVNMFYGTAPQTLTSSSVTFSPEYGSYNATTKIATITIPAGTYTENIEITITGTCDKGTCSKIFTVSLAKPGPNGEPATIYQIHPSVTSIKVDSSLSYSPEQLTVSVTKTVGSGAPQSVTLKTNDANPPYLFSKEDNGSWQRRGTNSTINVQTNKDTKQVQFKLSNSTSTSGEVLYDIETVPIVFDGKDPLVGDLDNEMVAFSVPGGNADLSYSPRTEFNFRIKCFNQDQEITDYDINITGNDSPNDPITVNEQLTDSNKCLHAEVSLLEGRGYEDQDPITITITGICSLGEVSKTFYVAFVQGGVDGDPATYYELCPSSSVAKKNSNNQFEGTLYAQVKKISGGKPAVLITTSQLPNNLSVYYSFDNSDWKLIQDIGESGVNILTQSGASNASKIYLKMEALISGQSTPVLIDYESIPVVSDGQGGITYNLKPTSSVFVYNGSPIEIYSYRSIGLVEELFPVFFLKIEKDIDGGETSTPESTSSASSKCEWSPSGDQVASVDILSFETLSKLNSYVDNNSGTSQPLARCTLYVQDPVVSLELSHSGTFVYPTSSDHKVTEGVALQVQATMIVGTTPIEANITSVTGDETYTTGMLVDNSTTNLPHGIVGFKTIPNDTVISPLIQTYTITASITIKSETITRSQKITFCPVGSGSSIQGANGSIIRFRGVWEEIVGYKNNTFSNSGKFEFNSYNGSSSEALRYIDVVQYNANKCYYMCNRYHTFNAREMLTANSPKIPGENSYWTIAEEFNFIFTDTLLANYIAATTITSEDVIILSKNSEAENTGIVAGMTSSFPVQREITDSEGNIRLTPSGERVGDVRIWAGTTGWEPNIQNASFRVTQGGLMVAKNAEITGTISATQFRLIQSGEERLYLSTYGELKSNPNFMNDNNFMNLGVSDSLPMFAVKDDTDEWYYIPLTKVEKSSGSSTTYVPKYGYSLTSTLNANQIINSSASFIQANSSNPSATTLYFCNSSDTSINQRYYSVVPGSGQVGQLWSGYFSNPSYSNKDTDINIVLQGNICKITIWSLYVTKINNGVANPSGSGYIFLGPSFDYSGQTLTANYQEPKFWKPIISGTFPTSSETSSTFVQDWITASSTISIPGNNRGSRPNDPTPYD